MSNLDTDDAGIYYCQADNDLGKVAKKKVTVDVLYGPRVRVEEVEDVMVGDDVTVECHVTANPAALSIEWVRNGEVVREGRILTLKKVAGEHSGAYTCQAVNICLLYTSDAADE